MAGTVGTGAIGTDTPLLPDERIVDMDPKIRVLRPDESQFATMTDRTPVRAATREKVNWLEEEDFPRLVTNKNAALSTDTTITLNTGQGAIVQPNDVLRNIRTGEAVRVTAVAADVLTIVRQLGTTAAASMNAGDAMLWVADAQPQGSDFPTSRYLARVLGYNYTQITRTTWTFTNTVTAIDLYGGKEPAKEAVRKAREHKRKWEQIGFFGSRNYIAASSGGGGNGEPQGFCGGLQEFIQTTHPNIGGVLTPTGWDSIVTSVMQYGSQNKVLFAGPAVVQCFSNWNRSGMGSYWDPSPRNVYGVNVDAFISGAYGYRIPVVVKKEWAEFGYANLGYSGYAFLVDMDYVERRPLQGRDTKLLTEQQPKGRDTYAAEYICEASYEIAHERAHGFIYGVTPPP
jgi:uncharacterized protein DUF5309